MGPLESAVNKVLEVNKEYALLYNFAYDQHALKFKNEKYSQNTYSFNYYKDFRIIDNKTLEIEYTYGSEYHEYSDTFTIDLTQFYRDEKLNILTQ